MNNNMEMTTTTKRNGKAKRVRCIETGTIYNSTSEAGKANNICQTLISDVCRGKWKSAKGLHFEYVDAEKNVTSTVSEKEKEIVISKPSVVKGKGSHCNGNTNGVFNFTNGDILTSCTDAADALGVSCGYMSTVLRNKGTVKGNRVRYIKDVPEHMSEISTAIKEAKEVKTLYNELLAKENRRKQLKNIISDYKGDIARLEQELAETYAKLSNVEQELINMD